MRPLDRSAAAAPRTLRRKLAFESLEDRRMLANVPELIELNDAGYGLLPQEFVQAGDFTYFFGSNANYGRGLWRPMGPPPVQFSSTAWSRTGRAILMT